MVNEMSSREFQQRIERITNIQPTTRFRYITRDQLRDEDITEPFRAYKNKISRFYFILVYFEVILFFFLIISISLISFIILIIVNVVSVVIIRGILCMKKYIKLQTKFFKDLDENREAIEETEHAGARFREQEFLQGQQLQRMEQELKESLNRNLMDYNLEPIGVNEPFDHALERLRNEGILRQQFVEGAQFREESLEQILSRHQRYTFPFANDPNCRITVKPMSDIIPYMDYKYPRKCFGCKKPLKFEEYLRTNHIISSIDVIRKEPYKCNKIELGKLRYYRNIWKEPIIQLYCCSCYNKQEVG